jgi:plastocyanin
MRHPRHLVFLAALALSAAACGGSDSSPSSPSSIPNDGAIAQTITITSAGVSPKSVTIPVGSRVTFVNNDTRSHNINSDPHPTHGSCPGMDNVLNMTAGQSRTTLNFTTAKTCTYHDHDDADNSLWKGTIVVQ